MKTPSPTPVRPRPDPAISAKAQARTQASSAGESPTFLEASRAIDRLLDGTREAVLTTHVNPDGDGLGAEAGLAAYLMSRGIQARILNADPAPRRFQFLGTEAVPLGVFRDHTQD